MGLPVSANAQGPVPNPDIPLTQTTKANQAIQNYNRQLRQGEAELVNTVSLPRAEDYRIGGEDLLEISVFEAPEFNTVARVSASGEISIPMLGAVHAAGLTPHELESVFAVLLRRTFMKDPHVSVFVKEIQSHAVSVFGAVKKPGAFQLRGAKTLVEVLSLAEGLADDAGDAVLIAHYGELASRAPAGSAPPSTRDGAEYLNDSNSSLPAKDLRNMASGTATEKINLKALLESSDPSLNITIYPGDSVTVPHAGIVYVVGEVKKPGGFQLKGNERVTVLQALALAEGLTRTAAKGRARIMRTDPKTGARAEISIDLEKVLSGKLLDPPLQSRDILFVPNSSGRSALNRGLETAIAVGSGLAIYRF